MSRAVQRQILAIAIAAVAVGGGGPRVVRAQPQAAAARSANAVMAEQVLAVIAERLNRFQGNTAGVSENQLSEAKLAVNWLRTSLTPEGPSRAMLDGLRADADALGNAQQGDERERRALIEATFDDLRLKRVYCRERPERMNALVRLTVQTWDGTTEVHQWRVAYLNAPLAILHRDQFQPFPKFSSPTEVRLPPGRYMVWAQDPRNAAVRGPATEVALGQNGSAEVKADIVVPRP
jgi:hypothetical protein